MANRIVHFEMMGPAGETQAAFYGRIFGWKTQATPGFDNYFLVDAADAGIGGAVGQGPEQMPNYLTVYVEVHSIDDHLAEIEAAGGTTVMPRTEIPDTVTFAMFADPAGNVVGLVETEVPGDE